LGAKDIPVFTYRDNRGEVVLGIAEGNRLGDAERVGLKKDCQRRELMPASGIRRL
jgi:hypothetical protein